MVMLPTLTAPMPDTRTRVLAIKLPPLMVPPEFSLIDCPAVMACVCIAAPDARSTKPLALIAPATVSAVPALARMLPVVTGPVIVIDPPLATGTAARIGAGLNVSVTVPPSAIIE